jgi:hypothetical protein
VSIRESFKALVQKRERRGRWVYLLWLAGYCVLAFVATAYAAVLGQDYLSALLFFLVPALLGYVQFRSPTLLGWVLLFIPTALLGVVAFCLFPWAVAGAVATRDFGQVLTGSLLLGVLAVVLHGFVRFRPFSRTQIAEPGAAPNGGPATRLGNSGVAQGPPSVS